MPQESVRRVINRSAVRSTESTDASDSRTSNRLSDEALKSQSLKKETEKIIREPYNEDAELEATTIDLNLKWKGDVIDKFVGLLNEIQSRHKENEKADIKDCYKQGLMLLTTIKKLNRVSHLRVNKVRNKTFDDKNKIDEHHLELQNLFYEISHIKKEVNKCLEFRSLDEDINLVSVDEFYKNAPPEISRPEVTKTDEHQQKLARLEWELKERQNMVGKIKALEQKIDKNQSEIKSKREQLDSLHPKLNQILDASLPTLQYLNMNFEDETQFSEAVQLLPRPLYILYMLMQAYKDTIDNNVKLEVVGEIDDAKKWNSNEKINFDEDDSESGGDDDQEQENGYKKKSKSKAKKKNNNDKIGKVFTPYPISVRVILTVKGYGQIILNFYYLNILKIVTLKPDVKLEKEIPFTDNAVLRGETLFSSLFKGDTGEETPNISNKVIFNCLNITGLEDHIKEIGWPYYWCQVLCGLYYQADEEQKGVKESNRIDEAYEACGESPTKKLKDTAVEPNYEDDDEFLSSLCGTTVVRNETKIYQKIFSKLKARFKSRVILQETINSLKRGVVPDTIKINPFRQLMSKLVNFRETSYEKYAACKYTEHFIGANLVNESDSTFFEINLHNKEAKLQAQIAINQNYPRIAPLFAIEIEWNNNNRNYRNDEAIRDMEREINIYKDIFIEASALSGMKSTETLSEHLHNNYELLTKQIIHLIVCFDIYLESESYALKNNEYPRSKFFLNAVRGKDRKRPYSYVSSRDLFVQRLNYDSCNDANEQQQQCDADVIECD